MPNISAHHRDADFRRTARQATTAADANPRTDAGAACYPAARDADAAWAGDDARARTGSSRCTRNDIPAHRAGAGRPRAGTSYRDRRLGAAAARLDSNTCHARYKRGPGPGGRDIIGRRARASVIGHAALGMAARRAGRARCRFLVLAPPCGARRSGRR